jgi:hypothetical protein
VRKEPAPQEETVQEETVRMAMRVPQEQPEKFEWLLLQII